MARALLAGTPVLILDEPTGHLDDQTAAALTRDLLAVAGDREVLLITHRTDDLAAVDEVIRFQGRDLLPPTGCRTPRAVGRRVRDDGGEDISRGRGRSAGAPRRCNTDGGRL